MKVLSHGISAFTYQKLTSGFLHEPRKPSRVLMALHWLPISLRTNVEILLFKSLLTRAVVPEPTNVQPQVLGQ